MISSNALKNEMLNAMAIDSVSLHDGDPGENGTDNELASASYARQSCAFNAAVNGSRQLSADVLFDLANGDAVAWIGYWEGTTFKGRVDVTDANMTADGQAILQAANTALNL
ncbi:phage tail fiber protein [Paraferrimonas sedimenticola]|uniref:Uncharacterized protein n=1 Tax=Paraferrimonas sedimenticola TaxID=375674 RepID=A0AA37RUB4_9GAMM|nr:hypothetical protein [Paraferrimonas sedimenticola]GLP95283.1 hypothetical protein GCM10007895_05890 [Paraferrimonas sedimenticola]